MLKGDCQVRVLPGWNLRIDEPREAKSRTRRNDPCRQTKWRPDNFHVCLDNL
jgi:hypothetical protein